MTQFTHEFHGREGARGRLFIECLEPPKSINIMPVPGTYKHPAFGKIVITEKGNQEFIDNFEAQVYQEHIPIDAEHKTKLSGALGFFTKLFLNDDNSVEAAVDWTERGQALLKANGFQYISPEWFDKWTDPATDKTFSNVLIGAAVTSRPFFKERALRPLVASEGNLWDGGSGQKMDLEGGGDNEHQNEDSSGKHGRSTNMAELPEVNELQKLVEEEGDEGKSWFASLAAKFGFQAKEESDDSEDANRGHKKGSDDSKVGVVAVQKDADDKSRETVTASEMRLMTEKVDDERKKRVAAEARIDGLEATERERRYRDIVLGRDESSIRAVEKDGTELRPMVGDLAGKVKIMTTLGEDSDEFKVYIAGERAHASQIHEAGLFSELGTDSQGQPISASAKDEFDQEVKTLRAKDEKLNQADAVARVASENPKLYARYDQEVTRREKPAS